MSRETRVLSEEEVMFEHHDSPQSSEFEETFYDENYDEDGANENMGENVENTEDEDEHSMGPVEEKLTNMSPEEIHMLMDQLEIEENEVNHEEANADDAKTPEKEEFQAKKKGRQYPLKKDKKPAAKINKQGVKLTAPQMESPSDEKPKQKRGRNQKVVPKEEKEIEGANQLPHSKTEEVNQKKGRYKKVEAKEQDETDGITQLPQNAPEETEQKKGRNKKVQAKEQDKTDSTTQPPPTTAEETKQKKGRNKKPQLKEEDEVKSDNLMENDEDIVVKEITSKITKNNKRMPKETSKVKENLNMEEWKADGNKAETNGLETKVEKTTKASKSKQKNAMNDLKENENPLKKDGSEKKENTTTQNERPKRNIVRKHYVEEIPKSKKKTQVKQPLLSQNSDPTTEAESDSKANEKVKTQSKKKKVTDAKENKAVSENKMPEKRTTRRK